MNLVEALGTWLDEQGIATLGEDLFISRAKATPSTMYWLVATGGNSGPKNLNQGFQDIHTIGVYYRNTDPQAVYDRLHELQALVMAAGCIELTGFTVIDLSTAGPFTDQDLDDQARTVGLLQITITTYKE